MGRPPQSADSLPSFGSLCCHAQIPSSLGTDALLHGGESQPMGKCQHANEPETAKRGRASQTHGAREMGRNTVGAGLLGRAAGHSTEATSGPSHRAAYNPATGTEWPGQDSVWPGWPQLGHPWAWAMQWTTPQLTLQGTGSSQEMELSSPRPIWGTHTPDSGPSQGTLGKAGKMVPWTP